MSAISPSSVTLLELRVRQLGHARDRPAGELLVPADPVDAREPRERVVAVWIEARALLRVDEVAKFGMRLLSSFWTYSSRRTGSGTGVVRRHDDVAADSCPWESWPWIFAKYPSFESMPS